ASLFLVWKLLGGLKRGRLGAGRLGLLAFSTSMALVCRPTNAFLLPFSLYLLAAVARAGLLGRLLRLAPAVLVGLAPLYAQSLAWHTLYGRFLLNTYTREGTHFNWTRPAAWQTLFSSRHGLFFWSPLLLVAAGGVAWRLYRGAGRGRSLLLCYLGSFLLLW